MKYLFIVSLSVLGLVACSESNETKGGEVVSKLAADGCHEDTLNDPRGILFYGKGCKAVATR